MDFLVDDDYPSQIKGSILSTVINNQEGIRLKAERKAQAEMTGYLNVRYDVPAIFSKTEDARNEQIVMLMVDITLYHLHCRLTPGQVPQIRMDRYDAAIDWLKMVAAGKLEPDLPKPSGGEEGSKNDVRWGGREARNPYY